MLMNVITFAIVLIIRGSISIERVDLSGMMVGPIECTKKKVNHIVPLKVKFMVNYEA